MRITSPLFTGVSPIFAAILLFLLSRAYFFPGLYKNCFGIGGIDVRNLGQWRIELHNSQL